VKHARPLADLGALLRGVLSCSGSDGPRTGPVTVTVTLGGPVAGVPVAFHRPDGAVQEVAFTDASGEATAFVSEGALVTVGRRIVSSPDLWNLTTIAGVEPGDALLLAEPPGSAQTGTATVAFAGPVAGASSYRVDAACTAAIDPATYVDSVSMQLLGACGTSLDVLAIARAPGGALLAYAMATDVVVGGTAPDQTASAPLGAWRTDFAQWPLGFTNAPVGSRFLHAALEPKRAGRRFFQSGTGDASAIAPGETAWLAPTLPAGFGTSVRLLVTVEYGADSLAWFQEPDLLSAQSFDLSARVLPELYGAALSVAGGSYVASWKLDGSRPAGGIDAAVLETGWSAANGRHTWRIVGPPTATSVALPPLPVELADFAPTDLDHPGDFGVALYDVADTATYAEFRATHLDLPYATPQVADLSLRGTFTRSGAAP
jgi:hypothetical protein